MPSPSIILSHYLFISSISYPCVRESLCFLSLPFSFPLSRFFFYFFKIIRL
ncbi:hypothetical protein CDL12_21991 [Handroanthus impetiginosus]|uniref:Uncharacterized protein n=1 Tax=Handroanthus impetiginosus TaxID=429701 RepID=A0A2G9GJK1_9LAMI|nr:hypothetical protein CDL12_21991 [Handroanthus impetiginosus]